MAKLMLVALLLAASSAFGEIYTWKDSRGIAHYTNSMYEIPARYQKKARVLDLGTGQKAAQSPVQPNGQLSPPASLPTQATVQGVTESPLQQKEADLQSSDKSERIRRLRDVRQQERLTRKRTPPGEKEE